MEPTLKDQIRQLKQDISIYNNNNGWQKQVDNFQYLVSLSASCSNEELSELDIGSFLKNRLVDLLKNQGANGKGIAFHTLQEIIISNSDHLIEQVALNSEIQSQLKQMIVELIDSNQDQNKLLAYDQLKSIVSSINSDLIRSAFDSEKILSFYINECLNQKDKTQDQVVDDYINFFIPLQLEFKVQIPENCKTTRQLIVENIIANPDFTNDPEELALLVLDDTFKALIAAKFFEIFSGNDTEQKKLFMTMMVKFARLIPAPKLSFIKEMILDPNNLAVSCELIDVMSSDSSNHAKDYLNLDFLPMILKSGEITLIKGTLTHLKLESVIKYWKERQAQPGLWRSILVPFLALKQDQLNESHVSEGVVELIKKEFDHRIKGSEDFLEGITDEKFLNRLANGDSFFNHTVWQASEIIDYAILLLGIEELKEKVLKPHASTILKLLNNKELFKELNGTESGKLSLWLLCKNAKNNTESNSLSIGSGAEQSSDNKPLNKFKSSTIQSLKSKNGETAMSSNKRQNSTSNKTANTPPKRRRLDSF